LNSVEIRVALKLSGGQVKTHLVRAAEHGLIVKVDSGRWYPLGSGHGAVVAAAKVVRRSQAEVEVQAARLVEVMRQSPGLRRAKLCEAAGITGTEYQTAIQVVRRSGRAHSEGHSTSAVWFAS
jgi:hypothetical protein